MARHSGKDTSFHIVTISASKATTLQDMHISWFRLAAADIIGGHTAEMLQLEQCLDSTKYTPRIYVMATTDTLSASKVDPHQTYHIPRSRHVGQDWLTVPWSTLKALLVAFQIIFKTMPDLILCNGPGSCVPICVAAYIPKILGIHPIQIIYVESFARVKSLSLTGRLLYPFVDRFLVQWPELQERYSKAEYRGILV
ncbi:hypothetical protein LRAMOSA04917 [Lichtheimia ramosa]|uniref:UDP-N-acetylglucosamine transferase subunit ALG14 n=1 Tax=Lichtheimia ramosa TaxID=688394 RepID=A0A077X0I4_9FUNG|nr:hypothetical protein LRAMOSA04917 [Lichtheimia ramosa]